eukprot:PhF_6_TR29391/c0_g2_i1/m.43349
MYFRKLGNVALISQCYVAKDHAMIQPRWLRFVARVGEWCDDREMISKGIMRKSSILFEEYTPQHTWFGFVNIMFSIVLGYLSGPPTAKDSLSCVTLYWCISVLYVCLLGIHFYANAFHTNRDKFAYVGVLSVLILGNVCRALFHTIPDSISEDTMNWIAFGCVVVGLGCNGVNVVFCVISSVYMHRWNTTTRHESNVEVFTEEDNELPLVTHKNESFSSKNLPATFTDEAV